MRAVALYARVSTDKQAEEHTIDSQLAELREVCKDLQPVREYTDIGWSGETLDRPGLERLREDTQRGEVGRLYIHSLDRLSRNLYQQGILVEQLRKHDVEIYIKDKPIDFTGEGKLLFDLLGAVAEYEKFKILERTQRGRLYKARTKGIVGTSPPFGYRYVKKAPGTEGRYVIDSEQAEVVRLIFELYLRYQSIDQVRKELTARGIKPPRRERWVRSTTHRILTNESYVGRGYYGMRQSVEINDGKRYTKVLKRGRRLRDRSEWIPINFPVIMDEAKFKVVQEVLKKRYRPYGQAKHFYLLSGLVRCARCHATFTGDACKGRFFYYRCNNRHRRFPLPRTCKALMVRREELDGAVWNAVSGAIMSPQILIGHIVGMADDLAVNRSSFERRRKELIEAQGNLAAKKDRLLDLYADGIISREQLANKVKVYERHGEDVGKEVESMELHMSQEIDRDAVLKRAKAFCRLASRNLKSLSSNERRRFLRYLLQEVVFDSHRRTARVIGHVPAADESLRGLDFSDSSELESGVLSEASTSRGQCPMLRFEMEVNV